MSDSGVEVAATRAERASAWATGLLHIGLCAAVLAEAVLVRASFDTDRFRGDTRPWAALLLATRNAAPIGVASAGAWLLVGWKSIAREYERLTRCARSTVHAGGLFLAHILVFAAFYWLTERIFVAFDGGPNSLGLLRVLGWGLAALAVPTTAAACAFPAAELLASLKRLLPSILIAVAIGAGAFGLSRFILGSGLWFPLSVGTTWLARWLLGILTGEFPTVEQPFVMQVGDFRVLITRHCSGFEGIGLIWTFLTAYFLWFREGLRFPRVLILLPIGTTLVWLANSVRIAALLWIGGNISPEIAIRGFHSYAGWIVFCALALGLVHVSRRIPWFSSVESGAGAPEGLPRAGENLVNPAAAYLGPFLGVLGVSFLTGAFSAGLDAFYPLRILAGGSALWFFRRELPRARWHVSSTGLLYGTAAFLIWIALERFGAQVPESEATVGLGELPGLSSGLWIAFRAVGFLMVAPLVEELAFRGFLARRLVRADFESVSFAELTPFAWVLSSLAFGLLHGQWIAGTIAGGLYGLAVMRRGRLADAVVAHATTNLLLVLSSLVLGPWDGWM